MWQEELIIETNSKKEDIWVLWTDVNNWNKWNTGIEYSYLNGKLDKDTWGSLKTSGRMNALYLFFQIKDCIQNKLFIIKIKLILCTIEIGHELRDEDNKNRIRHYMKIYGPLTFIYKKKIGKLFTQELQKSMKKLIGLAGNQ